jgi:hypothetical protein
MGLAHGRAALRVEHGRDPGPDRRHRAGAADDTSLPIGHDAIATIRIGIAGDVGHAASALAVRRRGNAGIDLIVRARKERAHPAAGAAAIALPDDLLADRVSRSSDPRAGCR